MATTTFTVTHDRAGDYQGAEGMTARNAVGRVVNFLSGCASGAYGATTLAVSATPASGTLTVNNFTATTLVYVGGVELPEVDAQATDELSAALIAFVINNPDNGVSEAVTATADGAVVTVVANVPGVIGNFITLSASGVGVTASGTSLSGGTTTTHNF